MNKAGTGVSLRLKTSTPAPVTNPYGKGAGRVQLL